MALKIKIKVFNSSMKIATCTDGQMSSFTQNIHTQRFGYIFCGYVLFYLFLSAVALLNDLFEDFKSGEKLTDCSNENLYEQQF